MTNSVTGVRDGTGPTRVVGLGPVDAGGRDRNRTMSGNRATAQTGQSQQSEASDGSVHDVGKSKMNKLVCGGSRPAGSTTRFYSSQRAYSNLSTFIIRGESPFVMMILLLGEVASWLKASMVLNRISIGVSPSLMIF